MSLDGMPLTWVVWRDYYVTSDWRLIKEVTQEVDLNDSVGYLVAEDGERLTLAQTVGREEGGYLRGTITIEKSCIEGRKVL